MATAQLSMEKLSKILIFKDHQRLIYILPILSYYFSVKAKFFDEMFGVPRYKMDIT